MWVGNGSSWETYPDHLVSYLLILTDAVIQRESQYSEAVAFALLAEA